MHACMSSQLRFKNVSCVRWIFCWRGCKSAPDVSHWLKLHLCARFFFKKKLSWKLKVNFLDLRQLSLWGLGHFQLSYAEFWACSNFRRRAFVNFQLFFEGVFFFRKDLERKCSLSMELFADKMDSMLTDDCAGMYAMLCRALLFIPCKLCPDANGWLVLLSSSSNWSCVVPPSGTFSSLCTLTTTRTSVRCLSWLLGSGLRTRQQKFSPWSGAFYGKVVFWRGDKDFLLQPVCFRNYSARYVPASWGYNGNYIYYSLHPPNPRENLTT